MSTFKDDHLTNLKDNAVITFCHPGLSAEVARKLLIEPLSAKIQKENLQLADDDDDEYVAQESVSTSIANTLERYLPSSTWREFVSNAE